MKTKEQIYVLVKNEEIRKKAADVLLKHNQNIDAESEGLFNYNDYPYLKFDTDANYWVTSDYKSERTSINIEMLDKILSQSASEVKLTLENIQVDCTNESEENIKQMANIFNKAEYRYYNDDESYALKVMFEGKYLYLEDDNEILLDQKDENKTIITYEKFMELFAPEEKVSNSTGLENKQPEPTISEYFESIKDLPPTDFSFKQSNKLGYIEQLYDEKTSPRPVEKSILQEAEEITNGSRAEDYGSVTENFTKIAVGWKEIFADGNFTPRRVALAMIWLKTCRDVNTPKHDNILDIAGYAGCIGKMDNEAN